jgi:hypothetical protein
MRSELFTYRKLRRDEFSPRAANPVTTPRNPFKVGLGRRLREAALTPPPIAPPTVRVFSGRPEGFVGQPNTDSWRRITVEEEARMRTGLNRETREPSIGVYVAVNNGRVKIGFDLWKLDVNLKPDVLERLEQQWREGDAVLFSKQALRRVGRKVHISKSFVTIVTAPERLEFWKTELESILSDAHSFELIGR